MCWNKYTYANSANNRKSKALWHWADSAWDDCNRRSTAQLLASDFDCSSRIVTKWLVGLPQIYTTCTHINHQQHQSYELNGVEKLWGNHDVDSINARLYTHQTKTKMKPKSTLLHKTTRPGINTHRDRIIPHTHTHIYIHWHTTIWHMGCLNDLNPTDAFALHVYVWYVYQE